MKTPETTKLEKALMKSTEIRRTFGVPEVTIGWYGKQRVDFMETNTRAIIRCYEIKVTKSDFHSNHGHNFVGNYNYYVMPKSLWEQVKDEVPAHVGVLVGEGLESVKKATKQNLKQADILKMVLYLCRSMSREVKKNFDSKSVNELAAIKRKCEYWKRTAKSYRQDIVELNKELRECKHKNRSPRR